MIEPAVKYQWITEAQNEVIADIAARFPDALYGAPLPLSTSDGGFTFTFGTDSNGYPLFPMGKVGIYPSLDSVPDFPWSEGYDYLNEGTRIRIPNNGSYAGTLYWRGIVPPPDISAAGQPSLLPEMARELITITAVKNFSQAGNINPALAEQMLDQYARAFPRWMLVFHTQFRSGGALGPLVSGASPYAYAAYPPGC